MSEFINIEAEIKGFINKGISRVEIIGGELILTLTDGTVKNLGTVKGEKGDDGLLTVKNAFVGQTVVVSAVDESGNPTAWEAVDFPTANEDDSFPYGKARLHSSYFESGTLWAAATGDGMGISNTAVDCIRTRTTLVSEVPVESGTVTLPLKKGDKIKLSGGAAVRAVTRGADGRFRTVADWTSTELEISESADYYLAFKFPGDVSANIAAALNGITVVKAPEEKIPDNSAKGIYAVMTYNTGLWYNGSGSLLPDDKREVFLGAAKAMIDRYSPDILCLQEYCDPSDSLLEERYASIVTAKDGATEQNYVGKAICSNREIFDATNTLFEANGRYDSPNYEKAYVWLNGRKVCIISAHFAVDATDALNQLGIIASVVKNEPYFIVCADTNIDAAGGGLAEIKAVFEAAGVSANVCNGGECVTYPAGDTAIDNIITSENIVIRSVIVDTQKEFLLEETSDQRDHYPLVAYIEIDGADVKKYLTIDSEVEI